VDAPEDMPNRTGVESEWYYDTTDTTIKAKNLGVDPYPNPNAGS